MEATETFKLGILGPFSGPSARTGDEFKASRQTWPLETSTARSGDYKIEPVWVDSQSDPAKAAQAYEQAVVQDGIQAGVLNWHSSVAVSAMEVTAKHKVPHFFGFGATEVVNETFDSDPEKYGYWTTKGWPTPVKLSISYVQALEDAIASGAWAPEAKTVAIYGEDTDWGRSFGNAIKGQLEEAGWTDGRRAVLSHRPDRVLPAAQQVRRPQPGPRRRHQYCRALHVRLYQAGR